MKSLKNIAVIFVLVIFIANTFAVYPFLESNFFEISKEKEKTISKQISKNLSFTIINLFDGKISFKEDFLIEKNSFAFNYLAQHLSVQNNKQVYINDLSLKYFLQLYDSFHESNASKNEVKVIKYSVAKLYTVAEQFIFVNKFKITNQNYSIYSADTRISYFINTIDPPPELV